MSIFTLALQFWQHVIHIMNHLSHMYKHFILQGLFMNVWLCVSMGFLKLFITIQKNPKTKPTYWAPGSSPPLVVCRRHIPTAVPRMTPRVLGISVGLVIDALAVVDRGAGCSSTLLLCCRPFIWVTKRLVHWLVVVRADHLSGGFSHATCHWTLCHGRESQSVDNRCEGGNC